MTHNNPVEKKGKISGFTKFLASLLFVAVMGALVWKNMQMPAKAMAPPSFQTEQHNMAPVVIEAPLSFVALPKEVDINTQNMPQIAQIKAEENTPTAAPEAMLAAKLAQATLQLTKGQDQATIKMGQMLAFMQSAFPQGGAVVRDMANVAYKMAEKLQDAPLANAIANMRNNTPRYGPTTQAELLMYVNSALQMAVPENAITTEEKQAEQSSWWRRKIAALVSVYKTESVTVDAWTNALKAVQLHMARGNITDAKIELNKAPLKEDIRLNALRATTDMFIAEHGKMNAVLTIYINTYLK